MHSIQDAYREAIAKGEIEADALQAAIVSRMEALEQALEKRYFWQAKPPGIYLYGPVGAGKTYLLNLFYQHLKTKRKQRFHFHHFMQKIDSDLRALQGKKDPLKIIAKRLAHECDCLFLDEFLVFDVAYAMILAELIQALVNAGLILCISSNTKPSDLYKNGVQRDRFLPAIKALESHCQVLHLEELRDYRLGRAPLKEAYFFPLNSKTKAAIGAVMDSLGLLPEPGTIRIQSRTIPYLACQGESIAFDFLVLCNSPRSQLDYLELADRFKTFFLLNIPVLAENRTLQVIMFIHLVDVLYDRRIRLIISAEVDVRALYTEGEMYTAFKRTLSRLMEMQSVDYLSGKNKSIL